MRSIGIWAGAALLGLLPGVVTAAPASAFPSDPPAGATAGTLLQPGGWGRGGWQGGDTPPPAALASPSRDDRRHGDYPRLDRGSHVPGVWLDPGYTVRDWHGWGFAPPADGTHWVRYYDDAMLIDADGRVIDARYGVDWAHGYSTTGSHAAAPVGYPSAPVPGVTTYRTGPNTVVTRSVVTAPPPVIAGSPGYGDGSVVSVSPGTITTITTITTEDNVAKAVAVRKAQPVRRPIHRRIVRKPSCACGS